MIFNKKLGPIFLKENSDAEVFIKNMEELKAKASGKILQNIKKQISLAQYGEAGERNIAFELKNSGMDMYVLRDIYLESGDLTAQIDYIVITRKCLYVIECKNLIGNIEIDNTGAFVRNYELFGKKVREGIYSPITQNQRHLQVLKLVRREAKNNIVSKLVFDKYFDDFHKSVVVLANPKTYLNARYAKAEVKKQVIRADQLVNYIKESDKNLKECMSDDAMLELAQFYIQQNKAERSDYSLLYKEILKDYEETIQKANEDIGIREEVFISKNTVIETMNKQEECIKQLKRFRLEQSRREGIKPYYIFNDMQMEDLLDKVPKSKEELLRVSGFGKIKVDKYGEEILRILQENE